MQVEQTKIQLISEVGNICIILQSTLVELEGQLKTINHKMDKFIIFLQLKKGLRFKKVRQSLKSVPTKIIK